MSKIIIVEGKTDKERLQEILVEPVEILCSHGTMGYEKLKNGPPNLKSQKCIFWSMPMTQERRSAKISNKSCQIFIIYTPIVCIERLLRPP